MPRQTHAYRRHKGGQAIATFGGRTVYLGRYGSPESKAKYERLCAEFAIYGRVFLPGDTDLSVAELLLAYMKEHTEYYRKNGKPTSEIDCLRSALRVVNRLYGPSCASEFGPRALKACRETMIEAGLARTTINDHVHRIRRVFRWAASEELIPASVADGLQMLAPLKRGRTRAKEPAPRRPVDRKDVDAILPFVSPQVAAMIELQWLTGMRPGEVISMRLRDIDRTGDDWLYRPAAHKTDHLGRERIVPLTGEALAVVRAFMRADPDAPVFQPRDAEHERAKQRRADRASPLTPSQRARKPKSNRKRGPRDRYSSDTYRRAITRACERAGVPTWTPHQLRHAAATRIRKQFGAEAARVVLGHSHLSTTEIYAERDLDLVRQVMRKADPR